jgi:hypothetical protein
LSPSRRAVAETPRPSGNSVRNKRTFMPMTTVGLPRL